jgi:tryptophan synthase alpha subunit
MEIKPGYKTTEFWISIANALLMALVGFGVLSQEQSESLGAAVAQAIVAGFALVAAIVPVIEYIRSRTQVKTGK